MGALYRTVACLRFFGDDLDPDEITAALGASPTVGVRKGGVWFTSRGVEKLAPSGSWRLDVPERVRPGNLDAQINELFHGLSADLAVWKDLAARYKGDVFCGLFLESGNDGLDLAPVTLAALGARGLLLGLDIYASLDDD